MKRSMYQSLVALTLLVVAPSLALARGTVLEIREEDIYVDLGHEEGVADASILTLHHLIRAKHPVSGKIVQDTFPLGQLRVVKVGQHTAVARADARLLPRVRVGDQVTLHSEPVPFVDPWQRPGTNGVEMGLGRVELEHKQRLESAKSEIADSEAVEDAWNATLGRGLGERRAIWEAFLAAHPQSRFRSAVESTMADIDRRIVEEAERAKLTPSQRRTQAALDKLARLSRGERWLDEVVIRPPTRAYEGSKIPVALLLRDPGAVRRAWLYYRARGGQSYQRADMRIDGDGILRGEIPGDAVLPPAMDLFVEILPAESEQPVSAYGSASEPHVVSIDASAEEPPPSTVGHSQVSVFMDYVDFDGMSRDFDQYLHGEVDFMYRFFRPIYSMRLGFGSMGGIGGPKDVIDASEDCTVAGDYMCRRVGYNYAYVELEQRFSEVFALMLRAQWGSARLDRAPGAGDDREFFDAFGVRGRVRLGDEMSSNLVLGMATTQRLGRMYEGAFTWDVIPRVPLVLSVQVTDQPVIEDYGVRLLADIGWRKFSWIYPSVRVAYQARDIDHAGASAGLAANFDW